MKIKQISSLFLVLFLFPAHSYADDRASDPKVVKIIESAVNTWTKNGTDIPSWKKNIDVRHPEVERQKFRDGKLATQELVDALLAAGIDIDSKNYQMGTYYDYSAIKKTVLSSHITLFLPNRTVHYTLEPNSDTGALEVKHVDVLPAQKPSESGELTKVSPEEKADEDALEKEMGAFHEQAQKAFKSRQNSKTKLD